MNGFHIQPKNGTFGKLNLRSLEEVSPTLTSTSYKEPDMILEPVQFSKDGEGISPTVPTGVSGGTTPKVAELQQFSDGSGISSCLDANYTKGTAPGDVGKGRRTHIIENGPPRYRIRKLTPLECWRLQGFSDEAHNEVKAAGISDSQRYKQAGNAVTVNVISALGKRLITILN